MGRKTTKKFIDKKKAATFQLMSRDSTDPNFAADAPGGDRIFVRVDNNPYSVETLDEEDGEEDPSSVFADASEDVESGEEAGGFGSLVGASNGKKQQLPEHVRREILELGFPDDGYNYLLHLREMRNTGGGSAFYQNPKTRLDLVPKDVKKMEANLNKLKDVNRRLRLEIRRRHGESLNGMTFGELCGLEQDMESAVNAIRERKYKAISNLTETTKRKHRNSVQVNRNLLHALDSEGDDMTYELFGNVVDDPVIGYFNEDSRVFALRLQPSQLNLNDGGSCITNLPTA